MDVEELIVKLAAAVAPKVTADATEKPVPVMLTEVPPLVGPDVGETAVTLTGGPAVDRCGFQRNPKVHNRRTINLWKIRQRPEGARGINIAARRSESGSLMQR
jgi:hypothetical protein